MEVEVAEADAHVVDEWSGDGDGERDAERGVRDGERDDVAVVKEEQAGDESPDECDGREDGVGQMREAKRTAAASAARCGFDGIRMRRRRRKTSCRRICCTKAQRA